MDHPDASEIAVDESITPEEQENEGFDWPSFAIAGIFALLIICLSLLFYALNLRSTISQKNRIIEKQQFQSSELESAMQKNQDILNILAERNLTMIKLSGLEINADGYGKIFLNANSGNAVLQVSNLPSTGMDNTYVIWKFRNNKPVKLGEFQIQGNGSAFSQINIPPSLKNNGNEFAISLESGSDVSKLTGEIYLASDENSLQSQ